MGKYSYWIYGFAMAIFLLLLRYFQWNFLMVRHSIEIYTFVIALLFTGLGIWLAIKLQSKTNKPPDHMDTIIENSYPEFSKVEAIKNSGLSHREMEVLQLMADGLSNQEIAEKLFLSLATVKTHGSNIFTKLNVSRRTQAIQRAKIQGLL